MTTERADTKALEAARVRLLLDYPFIGALAMHLNLCPAASNTCPTTATDARNIYFSPEYIEQLSSAEVAYCIAHETLHAALGHLWRRAGRNTQRWDIACDYAVNMLLESTRLSAPPNALRFPDYAGLSAEEIYPLIEENPNVETMDRHIHAGDKIDSSTPYQRTQSGEELEGLNVWDELSEGARRPAMEESAYALANIWRERVASAAHQAAQSGDTQSIVERVIDEALSSKVSWRALLAQFMTDLARNDWSFARPSTRRTAPAVMPGLRSTSANLAVAIDTSSSISDETLGAFFREIESLKSVSTIRVNLYACDERLAPGCPWEFEPWDSIEVPISVSGGGGTSFTPVFDALELAPIAPDALIYLTDGIGRYPKAIPRFPVLWVIVGNAKVPFGERVAWA